MIIDVKTRNCDSVVSLFCRTDSIMMICRLHVKFLQLYYLIGIVYITVQSDNRRNSCVKKGTTLACNHVPLHIPVDTQHVYINEIDIENDFTGINTTTWNKVVSLDVTADTGHIINGSIFQGFPNLRSLGIHASELTFLHRDTFQGLSKLKVLDLSFCPSLEVSEITSSLASNHSLPVLESLDLTSLAISHYRSFSLNKDFFEVLDQRPIKHLNLSRVSLSNVNLQAAVKKCDTLQTLNISNLEYYPRTLSSDTLCQSLEVIDWSHFRGGNLLHSVFLKNIQSKGIVEPEFQFSILPSLHTVILNHIEYGASNFWIRINGATMNCQECNFENITHIYLKENKLKWINITITHVEHIRVKFIDLSSNGLEYFYLNLLGEYSHVEELIFHDNMLHLMGRYPEFENIFISCLELQHIDLSKNGLTFIPKKIFARNAKLRILDLSDNFLETISFSLLHLSKVENLELRNNKLSYIDGDHFKHFSSFIEKRFLNTSNFHLDLSYNTFTCSCKGIQFIKWMYVYLIPKLNKHTEWKCVLDDTIVPIDDVALLDSQNLCIRTRVTIVAAVLAGLYVVTIIILVLLVKAYRKRWAIEKLRNVYIQEFKKKMNKMPYLVFIMFCQKDENFVENFLYETLSTCLKKLLKIAEKVVCKNFIEYRLGLPLISEAERCIRQSHVILLVVSRAFCQCRRCNRELKMALDKDKPIVVVYKDDIDNLKQSKLISPLLDTVMMKTVFSSVIQSGKCVTLKPSTMHFCKSLLDLAASVKE